MRQSRGVIKCQTNAERESRSERLPTARHGRYTAKRRFIQCWHKPLHCINTRFSAALTQKSGGRATSEIETQEEKAAAALGDWNHFHPSGISSPRPKLFLSFSCLSDSLFPLFFQRETTKISFPLRQHLKELFCNLSPFSFVMLIYCETRHREQSYIRLINVV